jgi:DNA repair photolyase
MATSPILRRQPPALRRAGNPAERKPTSLTLFPPAARPGNGEPAGGASDCPVAATTGAEHATELVGIARLAASSPRAEAKRGTEYFLLPSRSVLNEVHSERVPFRWTVNPYRGCEFGCRYCYARYTHEYMQLDGDEFEKKIFVKQNAGAMVERDLATGKAEGEHIAIGTATDPYQPAEKQFGATRAILEKLAARRGMSLSITTKSNQVLRDVDLLRRISEHSTISINMTITTLRPRLARLLEPRAPHPQLRLEAVRKLREAGIPAGVFVMPIIPGLTDREPDLDNLAKAVREAGALWFCGNTLFLMRASSKTFFAFLEDKLPRLAVRYRDLYHGYGDAPKKYRIEISERMHGLQVKYGLGSRPQPRIEPAASAQLSLGWNSAG